MSPSSGSRLHELLFPLPRASRSHSLLLSSSSVERFCACELPSISRRRRPQQPPPLPCDPQQSSQPAPPAGFSPSPHSLFPSKKLFLSTPFLTSSSGPLLPPLPAQFSHFRSVTAPSGRLLSGCVDEKYRLKTADILIPYSKLGHDGLKA